MLRMPNKWVFVHYEDGAVENVANTDTLSAQEALKFKERWEAARGKKVVRVTLENKNEDILRTYTY